jgi:hypothetical protein
MATVLQTLKTEAWNLVKICHWLAHKKNYTSKKTSMSHRTVNKNIVIILQHQQEYCNHTRTTIHVPVIFV